MDDSDFAWACTFFAAVAGVAVRFEWYGTATFFGLMAVAAGTSAGLALVAREVHHVADLLRERPR